MSANDGNSFSKPSNYDFGDEVDQAQMMQVLLPRKKTFIGISKHKKEVIWKICQSYIHRKRSFPSSIPFSLKKHLFLFSVHITHLSRERNQVIVFYIMVMLTGDFVTHFGCSALPFLRLFSHLICNKGSQPFRR